MKLLLDNGLPRSTVGLLNDLGYDVHHVGDRGLAGASDVTILDVAASEGRVVVTLDADFHTLLALAGSNSPSVMRIRIEGLKSGELSLLIDAVLRQFEVEVSGGVAISVSRHRASCRALPLG